MVYQFKIDKDSMLLFHNFLSKKNNHNLVKLIIFYICISYQANILSYSLAIALTNLEM